MKRAGVIFDLDGTLAHTLPDIADAVNAGLAECGLPTYREDAIRRFIGEGLPMLCRRAAGEADVDLDRMVAVVSKYYVVHRTAKVRPFDGIPELLDELVGESIPMGVVTNKPHEHVGPIMDKWFSRWQWTAVEGYKQEDRRKPDPRTAVDVARLMNVEPGDVLFVGDSKTDIETGLNAGMMPVGCTWGYRDRDELVSAGAARVIDAPFELADVIRGWRSR